ncbi:MAG: CoxG family protein [Sphingomonadaceae bacterium]
MTGSHDINAKREAVWAALNDPDVLARCIEGVESLTREDDNRFTGAMAARVGPVKARFTGTIELTEIDPPNRYVLVGEGKGGVAGFAKGRAEVSLSDRPEGGTRLEYRVESQVGGKLAQLGARLVEGAARGYADSFFTAFKAELEGAGPVPAAPDTAEAADIRAAATAAAAEAATSPARGLPAWAWIGGLILLVVAVLVALAQG